MSRVPTMRIHVAEDDLARRIHPTQVDATAAGLHP